MIVCKIFKGFDLRHIQYSHFNNNNNKKKNADGLFINI